MPFFTEDYLAFFRELAANNNRDWFTAHKKRYEQSVKLPFERFLEAMIAQLPTIHPVTPFAAKDAIFRIYRDVRFSKDKEPYKVFASAVLNAPKNEWMQAGFYFEIGPENVGMYAGMYQPDKDQLYALRAGIVQNLEEFEALRTSPDFMTHFKGEFKGERNKILPAEFKEAAAKQPIIANKQYYYHAEAPAETILRPDFDTWMLNYYRAAYPMNDFLNKLMSAARDNTKVKED